MGQTLSFQCCKSSEITNKESLLSDTNITELVRKSTDTENKRILSKIGDEKVMEQVVDSFYRKILNDKKLALFYQQTNIRILKFNVKHIMIKIFGGKDLYKGRDLIEVHKHLDISNEDYDLWMSYFADTLREFHVEKDIIIDVIKRINSYRTMLVTVKND